MAKSLNRGLGALAALGALSYHLSKSGRRTDGGAPVEDRNVGAAAPTAAPATTPAAAGDDIARFADVGTNLSESGQPYSLMATPGPVTPAATAGTRAATSTPAVRAASPASLSAAAMDAGYVDRPNISESVAMRTGVKLNSRAGAGRGIQGGPTASELEAYRKQQERRDKLRASGGMRAKGGAIKAKPKKMASGGMSSASKRADGIASKGKTKCKMY